LDTLYSFHYIYELGYPPSAKVGLAVVDSWALPAWLRDEKPAAHVHNALQQAEAGDIQLLMSWINAGEVYYMLARKHSAAMADEFLTRLPSLPTGRRVALKQNEPRSFFQLRKLRGP
jgi:hypothetical protein